MKHLPLILIVFLALLDGAALGAWLEKWRVCRTLADAMELRAWDIVCAEPLDNREAQRTIKEES